MIRYKFILLGWTKRRRLGLNVLMIDIIFQQQWLYLSENMMRTVAENRYSYDKIENQLSKIEMRMYLYRKVVTTIAFI